MRKNELKKDTKPVAISTSNPGQLYISTYLQESKLKFTGSHLHETQEKKMRFEIKNTILEDVPNILKLYQTVARESGGIIRTDEEITLGYIEEVVRKSMRSGIGLIIYHPDNPQEAIAEIHTYSYGLTAFRHILTDLTVVVHPGFQGQKLGKRIFEQLLTIVAQQMPHILRVELFVRENNLKAIEFYKKLGFTVEGRHKDKIKNKDNSFETPLEMTWFNSQYKN